MKRICIYCHNEDTEALRPLRERLEKKGASVRFQSVKYAEITSTDQVLTLPKYLEQVTNLFAGTGIPVTAIGDDTSDVTDTRDPIRGIVHSDAVVLTVGPATVEPEPEVVVEPPPEPEVVVEPPPEPEPEPEPELPLTEEATLQEEAPARRKRSTAKDEE